MKNLKNLLLLFVSIVAVSISFASCNTDSTDYSLDVPTQKQLQSTMAGGYTGKAAFMKANTAGNKLDTIAVENMSWNVRTDSTFIVRNFPVNRLDSAVNVPSGQISNEATQLRALRDEISKLGTQDLTCYYWVPGTNWMSSAIYQFIVNPVYFSKKLTYNGETHDVYFVFQMNNYIGQFSVTSRQFQFSMVLASICIDKTPTDYNPSFPASYFRPIYISFK